jgi:hypothetical protein
VTETFKAECLLFCQGPGNHHGTAVDLVPKEEDNVTDHSVPFIWSDTTATSVIPWPSEENECSEKTLLESLHNVVSDGAEAIVINKAVVVKTLLLIEGQEWEATGGAVRGGVGENWEKPVGMFGRAGVSTRIGLPGCSSGSVGAGGAAGGRIG